MMGVIKRIWPLFLVVLVLLGGAGVFVYLHKQTSSASISTNIKTSASFTLYYPSTLPAGYSIPHDSFSQTSQVVTYYAQNQQGDKLFFSIQPVPPKDSLKDFNSRVLQNKVNVLSDEGTAAVGTINNRATGSLVTSKSWVLVTSSQSAGEKTISTILSGLKQD